MAWVVALPALVTTILVEWSLAKEQGPTAEIHPASENVGQYQLMIPAALLVAAAVWLTMRAADVQWSPAVGALGAAVAVLAAGFGALALGEAAGSSDAAAACGAREVAVLESLPMFEPAGESPRGYAGGGCYLRYIAPGGYAEAATALSSELRAAGWVPQDGGAVGQGAAEPIYVNDGVLLYVEAEGTGNLEDLGTTEGETVFRLTVYGASFATD